MNQTATLAGRCSDLFAACPLAVIDGDAMILMRPAGSGPEFYVLTGAPEGYELRRRRSADAIWHSAGSGGDAAAAAILSGATPIPCHGSLSGWRQHGTVAALIMADTSGLVPTWALYPGADLPRDSWPPFTGEHRIGWWFWEHMQAGSIVDLAPLVAATRDQIFWIPAGVPEVNCIAVRAEAAGLDGITLPRGRYAHHKTLSAGIPLPSMADLLADPQRVDLGPRFPLDALRAEVE